MYVICEQFPYFTVKKEDKSEELTHEASKYIDGKFCLICGSQFDLTLEHILKNHSDVLVKIKEVPVTQTSGKQKNKSSGKTVQIYVANIKSELFKENDDEKSEVPEDNDNLLKNDAIDSIYEQENNITIDIEKLKQNPTVKITKLTKKEIALYTKHISDCKEKTAATIVKPLSPNVLGKIAKHLSEESKSLSPQQSLKECLKWQCSFCNALFLKATDMI